MDDKTLCREKKKKNFVGRKRGHTPTNKYGRDQSSTNKTIAINQPVIRCI